MSYYGDRVCDKERPCLIMEVRFVMRTGHFYYGDRVCEEDRSFVLWR